jgi:hypothetical protein
MGLTCLNILEVTVAAKKSFPLRINPEVLAAMQRWSDDELRSVNAQIEYILRKALVDSGRVKLTQKVVTVIEESDVLEK